MTTDTTTTPSLVLRENVDDGICVLTLNDPQRRNALGLHMMQSLLIALHDVGRDDAVRVVVMRGSGAVFCAGFDLQAAVEEPALMAAFIERLGDLLKALRRLPQPVIASVHGAAIAGGCALVSACDFVIASRSCRFGYPVHRLGVSPAVTLPTLCQAVGAGHARSLVMEGQLIDSAHAVRIGLVTSVVDNSDDADAGQFTLNAALQQAGTIASHGPNAVRITKQWLNELDGSLDDQRFAAPAESSAALADDPRTAAALRLFWDQRRTSSR